jgi:hypothetical protein
MKNKLLQVLFIAVALTVFIQESSAIPSFARKYGISCTTCHSPAAPALKPYGDDFAGDGFRLAEEQAPRYFMETGDTKLSLLRQLPLAVRLDGFVTYNFDGSGNTDFASPYALKLLSGGEISNKLSYYFYFYMSEQGEVAGVEDAFLMYNDLFDIDLDIYLGQFQVSDPLFKRELRLSLEDYHVYTSQIGISNIDMKYDKGLMVTLGLPTGTGITLEVVNGNGIGEAHGGLFDKDQYKNVMGHLSQGIGNVISVGAFAYTGKENLQHNTETDITNEVLMWGPDLSITPNDKWTLNAQYLMREDLNVYRDRETANPMQNVGTQSAMAELIFSPQGEKSDWYLLGLYNWTESDFAAANYHSASFHAGYLLSRNIRLAAEYTLDFTDTNNPVNRFSVGFVAAF